MNINLFIVESPFQLLSAIEANNYFKDIHNVLIIKYSEIKRSDNNEQLRLLKTMIHWNEIYEIDNNISSKQANLKLLFLIKKIKAKFEQFDKIFIGEYRSWVMREYLNILHPKECYLLDDGNIVIQLQKTFLKEGHDYYFGSNYIKQKINRFLHLSLVSLLYFNSSKKRTDINLFTCFDLKKHSTKQIILKHSFEFLKKQNTEKTILKNVTYFFGGNLSELNIMSEVDELKELKKVKAYFLAKNVTLVYLPHRRESHEKLSKISSILGIEVKFLKYPAEIEFVLMKELPEFLSSFASTALYSVSKICNFNEVIAFALPYQKINKIYLNDFITVYDEYENIMKVIRLNELI